MGEVPSPRAVMYTATCHQWFCIGASASRVLPTICVQSCSVLQVSSHCSSGRRGHASWVIGAALRRTGRRLHDDLIDEAPAPVLARLEAADDRMMDLPEVLGGVLVGRVVAATHMTARQAQTEVNPFTSHRQTLFAAVGGSRGHVANLIQVRASFRHRV